MRRKFLLAVATLIIHFAGNFISTTVQAQVQSKEDLEALYWARIDSSRMNFTQADVDFMTGMIGHHAQALIMSDLAPENNASPAIQTLAARIINAQNDEIATMQNWLKVRNQPVPMVHIDGLNLEIHMEGGESGKMNDHAGMDHANMNHDEDEQDSMAMGHHHDMPGMLTQAQLEELSEAKGAEFDRKFLAFMVQHHEGAVIMVRELFGTDGAALDEDSFRLASDIQVDQITEIERMRLMLSQMNDAP